MRLFASLHGYRRPWLRGDLIAGLTLWSILVPQALAYASIANVSPVVGLYAAPGALLLYLELLAHLRRLRLHVVALGEVGLDLLLLELRRSRHRLLDLGAHVGHGDDHEPACPASRCSPSSLRSWRLMPAAACPATAPRIARPRGRAGGQRPADRREREERDHDPGREPDPAAQHAANTCRRLVLLDDRGRTS
ncbi:MAG TPA: SulP family inorganic anion transporter [Solirubrobacteraceae bacterium]|nr:SulP family inorganic anion transporter [Solirubrobacteraceae bacterium]